MLKELVKVANKLDHLGLTKEADFIDEIISKFAAATRIVPPTIPTHLIRSVVSERANDQFREANKTMSSAEMGLKLKSVERLHYFLDNAGDKVFITTNDDYYYSLWLEDPLDKHSRAEPGKYNEMEVRLYKAELIDAIGEDHFRSIKDKAREAGYIADEIQRSGYGRWQFSGDLSVLDESGS